MTDTKIDPATVDIELDTEVTDLRDGNARDRRDMTRMGKAQELKRNFRFLSIFGFSMILMQAWESVLAVGSIGLTNGGTAGYIWMFLICWIGFGFVNTSMAEMGSMAPTTGGQVRKPSQLHSFPPKRLCLLSETRPNTDRERANQYHWVSEFAPRKYQRFLSYVMGWMCVLSWQTGCASSAYISGGQIQGLIALNHPSYQPQGWHTTMFSIAVAAFSVFFNAALARKLPLVEAGLLSIHVLGFIALLVVLWVLSPITPAAQVFTSFNNGGGGGTWAPASWSAPWPRSILC
ncbi:hypothetical protein PG988_003629 [Apiospora saccharicola]